MANFKFKALRSDNTMDAGTIEASSRQEAFSLLEGRGLKPVGLEDTNGSLSGMTERKPLFAPRTRRVPFRALESFTRQLSSLLAAGVPLARSLQILHREAPSPIARSKWKEIHDLVVDGTSLADSMSRSPETFPRVYVAMVQAGETGGFLEVVLGQIAEFQYREKELKSRVIAALIYPAILLVLAIAVVIFLLIFFIPRFQLVFEGFGATLPWITLLIIAASRWLRHYGPFIAIAIAAAAMATRSYLASDQGRRTWQRIILKIPVLGPLNSRFALTRFCRMLGTLTGAGVPLISALKVARESIGNQTLVDALTSSIERVRQGEALSKSLAQCTELFPQSVLAMISVAEETGTLDHELVRLSTVAESDLDRQLKMAVSLAEPLLLFLMAAFIGTIFFGMVIPIFSIQDYIK